jgi:hypothetical protein
MLILRLLRGFTVAALSTVLLLSLPPTSSTLAQTGTEGSEVIVNGTGPVIATYQGNSATYSDDLYLVVDGNPAHDMFIFNNHETPVGTKVSLGSFPVGTELLFRLHVRNTGRDYYTGPGNRNPDSHSHARAQANWKPNETLVSFEDLFNGPFNYNDLIFSFVPTTVVAAQMCLPPFQEESCSCPAGVICMIIGAQDPWKFRFCSSNGFVGPSGQFAICQVVFDVNAGDRLIFNANGTWQDGASTSGPGGSDKPGPDNFRNFSDFGLGPYEAREPTPHWDAVVGYIGPTDPSDPLYNPPARGSYASPQYTALVGERAKRVFPVFPPGETSSVVQVKQAGRLWLTFNADAYSNYTIDNAGAVTVNVEKDTPNSRPPTPDLDSLCKIFGMIPEGGLEFQVATVVCKVANKLVGGSSTGTAR